MAVATGVGMGKKKPATPRPILIFNGFCVCAQCLSRLTMEWVRRYGPEVLPQHFHSLRGTVNVGHYGIVGAPTVPDNKPQQPVDSYSPLRCGKDPLQAAPRKIDYYEKAKTGGGDYCDCVTCCTCKNCTRARQGKDGC